MSNQDTYRKLCQTRTDIPLFMQAWWLDATNLPWDVIFYQEKDQIAGIYVYSFVKKWGKTLILQPTLTQYSGPFLFYPEGISQTKKYSLENKAHTHFIAQLEAKKFHFLEQNWHHSQQNWQPYYWNKFKQTTRYTYILENIANTQAIFKGLSENKKRQYKKAEAALFTLSLQLSAQAFYQFYNTCLQAKGQTIIYSFQTFEKLYNAAKERGQGQIFAMYDNQNQLHTALWVIWDNHCAYDMITPINATYRNSGATTRIIFEAMAFLQGKTMHYDFEGSMIEGSAHRNQLFGAKQVAYHQIQKSHSKLLSLWRMLKK